MKPSLYPEAYRPARRSPYRRKIASMAEPLPKKIMRCIETSGIMRPYVKGAQDKAAFILEFAQLGKRYGFFKGIKPGDPTKNIIDILDRKGYFLDVSGKTLFAGPLLGKSEMGGIDVYVAAMDADISGTVYFPRRHVPGFVIHPRVAIDAVTILERAISKINVFRHKNLDAAASPLFLHGEPSREKLNAFLRILEGEFKEDDLKEAVKIIPIDRNYMPPLSQAIMILQTMQWLRNIVVSSWHDDDIQHALNLCNLLTRSSLIVQLAMHHEFEVGFKESGIDETDDAAMKSVFKANEAYFELIGWMADLAYGNPYMRLGEIQALGFEETNQSYLRFKEEGMDRIAIKAGLAIGPTERPKDYFYRLLTSSDRMGEVAQEALDELYWEYYGKTYRDAFPALVEAFEIVNATDFIRREHLPIVAHMWRDRYYAG